MVIYRSINANRIYSNLGSVDPAAVADLRFQSIRKNTRQEVEIAISIIEQNERWIIFDLDGEAFQEGEHTYKILDSSDNVLENGLLFVKNGPEQITGFDSSLEGEKGEHR